MDDVTVNTAFTFSKLEVLKHGLQKALEPSVQQLIYRASDDLVEMVGAQLQDEGNCYQFVLTIKKIDADPELQKSESESEAA